MSRPPAREPLKQDLPLDLGRFNGLPHGPQDALAASQLLAELRTGTVVPGNRSVEGWEEQALRGAGRLAPCVRRLLASHHGARRFELVAVALLNDLIRPRTLRWRRWLAGRGANDELRRQHLRRELNELQRALPRVIALLEAVRQGRELVPDDLFMGVFITTEGPPPIRAKRARDAVEAGIRDDVGDLFARERPEILARRAGPGGSPPAGARLDNVSGLALSGGGIRSATFALGLVQVLARRGLFDQLDYLSTVSGGGYLGTFLSSYLNRPGATAAEVFGSLGEPSDTPAVRHLRNHSKFLGEGGALGRLQGFLLMVFGIATNLIALLPFVVLAVLVTWVLKEHVGVWGSPGEWVTDWSALLVESPAAIAAAWLLGAALVAQLVVRPMVSFLTRGGRWVELRMRVRSAYDAAATWLTVLAAAAAGFALLPLLFEAFEQGRWGLELPELGGVPDWLPKLLAAALPALLSGALASRFRDTRIFGTALRVVFLVSGPLFLVWLYLFLGSRLFDLADGFEWPIFGAMVLVLGFLWVFMDLNALSPHSFYRDRLAKCYLVQPGNEGEQGKKDKEGKGGMMERLGRLALARVRLRKKGKKERKGKKGMIEPLGRLDLSALGRNRAAPFHLINATVNLPASRERDLRGRKGDFFCFSKTSCGSRLTGYTTTTKMESWDPGFDLGTAMAVSGAAVSSSMARKRLDHLRFFMTLLNARLGYWLPNVPHLGWIMRTLAKRPLRHKCSPGPDVLLREMAGWMEETDTFINLSDGGHIENLGVYELLRRRARYVIAVDGESDSAFVYDALIKLIRYARIDLGAEIDIDLTDLDPDESGQSRAHSALGKITYRDGAVGWLLYAKLSLSGDENLDILDYRREQPSFPHQSTLDQLFEEEQFEAYRALGQHVAEELFREELLAVEGAEFRARSESGETDLPTWFDALVRTMRSESDPVFRADPTSLGGWRIGISISNSPGVEPQRTNEATLAICKMLIAKGGAVVLGHDWRPGGIMREIARFAEHDRLLHRREPDSPAIFNYVERGEHDAPPEPVPEARLRREVLGSLPELRRKLTRESHARICLGGKLEGFEGPIPGVLEEALLASRAGQAVLVSAALGGAAGWLAESLLDGEPEPLPSYSGEAAARLGLPKSPAALVEELAERFGALAPQEHALHRRLWQTTTLAAAQAVIVEILRVATRRAPAAPDDG